MEEKIFEYIDRIYETISDFEYNYEKSEPILVALKNEINNENFVHGAYYYQLMATLEYFIFKSFSHNTPYENLLPKNSEICDYFIKSLSLDSDNTPLRYLYAIYLYNTGEFLNAKKQLLKIDTQYYEDIDMPDRIFKIHELIICCQIFLNDIEEDEIINFLKNINSLEDILYPSDLIETLIYNKRFITNSMKYEIKKVMHKVGKDDDIW